VTFPMIELAGLAAGQGALARFSIGDVHGWTPS
jgi:hypothetical protein